MYPAYPMCDHTETRPSGTELLCVAPYRHASPHYLWTMDHYTEWVARQNAPLEARGVDTYYVTRIRSPFTFFAFATVLSLVGFGMMGTYIVLKWWGLA